MSLSIFHGSPASDDGQSVPSGIAQLGIDVTAGVLYYKNPQAPTQPGWRSIGNGPSSDAVVTDPTADQIISSGDFTLAVEGTEGTATFNLAGVLGAGSVLDIVANSDEGPNAISIRATSDATDGFEIGVGAGVAFMGVIGTGGAQPSIEFDSDGALILSANTQAGVVVHAPLVISNAEAFGATVGGSAIAVGSTIQDTVGAAGAASALPATPAGFLQVNIGGVNSVIPFYAAA